MTELEFRRRLLESPNQLDEAMQAYLAEHPDKAADVKAQKAFEAELKQAMRVMPPEGLEERILLKSRFEEPPQNDGGWFGNLTAFAASFALVAVFAIWQWPLQPGTGSVEHSVASAQEVLLEQAVVDHIIDHAREAPDLMKAQPLDQDEASLQKLFAKVGAVLDKPVDFMSYAGECEVNGQKGLHLVLQEEAGPVTIIVLPGKQLTTMQAFNRSGFQGQMIPVKGAMVAIVGDSYQELAMAQMHFFKAVRFG
ncbi:DUF3379 family protein [Thiomicrospira sp. S5]|uniref:DUF3379 family protein n=1 Tax=Thiomicrospira sp. S5 TaxID=1803865 RepID=UPI000F8A0DD8|nr:DUF3379 family protein [Thiomicrospira sp. S5]AZR81595.1 hypothetical protein AYJ59_04445 [Thiomicrospira sp. S5]